MVGVRNVARVSWRRDENSVCFQVDGDAAIALHCIWERATSLRPRSFANPDQGSLRLCSNARDLDVAKRARKLA